MMIRSRREASRDLIQTYLRSLDAGLRGPSPLRRRLVDEIDDHLEAAIHSRMDRGQDRWTASLGAIEELGSPQELASGLQPALSTHHTRIGSLGLLLASLGIGGLWVMLFVTGPHSPWGEAAEPRGLALADLVGATAMRLTLAIAVVAILVSWVGPRLGTRTPAALAAKAYSLGTLTLSVTLGMIVAFVVLRGSVAPTSLEWSDVTMALPASAVVVGVLLAMRPSVRIASSSSPLGGF